MPLALLMHHPVKRDLPQTWGSFERKNVRAVDVASEMVIQEALTVTHP